MPITLSFSLCLSTGFPSYSWLTTLCSVVSDICHFFLLHFHLSFLLGLWPTQLQMWVGLKKVNTLLFHLGTESGIFLICLLESTGKCLNRLFTALGVGLFLLKIALQLATTYMLSKCTTKYYPSSGLVSSKSPLLLI